MTYLLKLAAMHYLAWSRQFVAYRDEHSTPPLPSCPWRSVDLMTACCQLRNETACPVTGWTSPLPPIRTSPLVG
jgi:hypothetical protein